MKTIKGILIAQSWDTKGVPTELKLCAKAETDYVIFSSNPAYLKLIGKSVTVNGIVKRTGKTNILTIHTIEETYED